MHIRRTLEAAAVLALLMVARAAVAAAAEPEQARLRVPEPILLDSTTDIDSDEAGDLEVNVRRGVASGDVRSTVEGEWRVMRQFGVSLELENASKDQEPIGTKLTIAWIPYHDYALDLHLQAFAGVQFPLDRRRQPTIFGPSDDSRLPFSGGVHGALRRGALTFRTQLGVDAGGTGPDRLLVRGRSALLLGGRIGFVGVEMLADVGRTTSSAIAAEFAVDVPLAALPLRLALAVPFRLDGPRSVGMITAVSTDLR